MLCTCALVYYAQYYSGIVSVECSNFYRVVYWAKVRHATKFCDHSADHQTFILYSGVYYGMQDYMDVHMCEFKLWVLMLCTLKGTLSRRSISMLWL